MSEQRTTKLSEAIEEAAENGKRRLSYFSFGDDGLTATVGASGSLLRITQHFPGERTGFCVDVPGLPDPSYVEERLKSFLRSSRLIRPRHVIGPNIDSLCRRRSFRLHANDSMTNDRWPTFDRELLNGDDLTLQYVASKGTIYQIFEMSGGDDKLPPLKVTPDLLIRDLDFVDEDNQFNKAEAGNKVVYYHESRGNCLIRVHENSHKKAILYIQALNEEMSLEFIRDESTSPTSETPLGRFVNTKPYFGQSYKQRPTEEGPDSEEVTTKESAARKLGASWSYRVHRKSAPKLKYKLRQEHPKDIIILSYTLEYVPKHEEPTIPSMSWSSILETKDQLLMPWKPYNISEDQTVDFFLKRNLEHILSVCSIPVRRTIGEWRPAVALTCGDVDSHRVATGASFHAFQILLLALGHFTSQHSKPQPEDWACECGKKSTKSYICVMKQRILRVCLGHLKWILERANKSGKPFCPHYWVDGSEIEGWKRMDFLVGKSLVDTPLHLIKIGDLSSHSILSVAQVREVRRIASNWIMELKRVDKRKVCAFPRYDKKATRSFYLTDHALIWKAIKSVELIVAWPWTMTDHMYSSKCVQQNILKRFTTQNPVSKRETIAVVRSPLYTRFLLQSKDSAIFSAMEMGLFDKPGTEDSLESGQSLDVWHGKIDAWKNTIDCQRHHQDNDDTTWNDPQRFALSIILCQHLRKAINQRSPQEMLEQAFSILFSSSSANGLFPGKLDNNYKPTLYDSELTRDVYWENTFEIPHVLWRYCRDLTDGSESTGQPESSISPSTPLTNDDEFSQSHSTNQIIRLLRSVSTEDSGFKKPESPPRFPMKKAFPFNNMTDTKNIVELQDEWLYNLPAFFVPAKKGHEKREDTDAGSIASEYSSAFAASLATSTGKASANQELVGFKFDFLSKSAKKRSFKDNSAEEIRTRADVAKIIARGRTQDVKKRIWVFMSSNPLDNRIGTSTVSETEKKEKMAIEAFLKNHESFDSYFWEDTVAELNTWETEFQLSYYTLCSNDNKDREQRNDVHKREEIVFPSLSEGGNQIHIAKAVVGFRLEGDFFDRFWTSRFLISDPDWKTNFHEEFDDSRSTSRDEVASRNSDNDHRGEVNDNDHEDAVSLSSMSSYERSDGTDASGDDDEDNKYEKFAGISRKPSVATQRRILELIHSWQMISTMNNAARAVLNVMKEHLENGKGNMRKSFAATQEYRLEETEVQKLDFKGFLVASRRFQEFQLELQKVEAHFSENLATIDLWLSREKSRQAERPRWSFNDESRWRAEIQKFVVTNDRSIREFRSYQQRILALIETTTKDLEIMHSWLDILRNDLELRRGEDIKRFTYVTVVFLPLGFATGIFSTSGAPAGPTLINMILTAITTLTITVLALVGYKFADSPRSREELVRRWVSFEARWLKLMIMRILLVMLFNRLKSPFSKGANKKAEDSPEKEADGDHEDQERELSERYEDEDSQVQRDRSEEGARDRTSEVQRSGAVNGQDKWRWGAILRSFRIRGTGNLDERFREDVERRASSDAVTVSDFEGASLKSRRTNSASLRRQMSV